jgi:glycosyltransferase involved in cell wall biosynthesis
MSQALAKNGHKVVIATGRAAGKPDVETHGDIRIFRFYGRADIGKPWVTERVLELCRDFRIDIVEGEDYLGDCAGLLKRRHRPPVLIKAHSCNTLRVLHESLILYPWQRLMIKLALLRNFDTSRRERCCLGNADLLLTSSKRILQEMEKQGVKLPSQCMIVANPIRLHRVAHDQEATVPTVLFVGRKDFGKGIQYLPGIVAGLSRLFPDLRMEIVGPDSYARGVGSMQAWLEQQLGGLKRYVVFHPRLSERDLEAVYRRAWVVALPSRWDTFQTVLLEAMSWGKPVVASPHGGMPEMLAGTLCRTISPDDGAYFSMIKDFLNSRRLRKTAGYSLFARANAAFTPRLVADEYVKAIRSAGLVT